MFFFTILLCQKVLLKKSHFTLLLSKNLAFEIIYVRSIAKSDPAIEHEPTTYCNISPNIA